jgi:hypothetical protein
MKTDYKIPFEQTTGDMLGYLMYLDTEWRDNYEFEAHLKVVGWGRGRSSITFTLVDTNGVKYSTFASTFYEMIPHMSCGEIRGTFTFCKKGQNYGLKLISAKKTTTDVIREFAEQQLIYSPETIHQTDRVITNAYGLIEDLCDIAGYYVEVVEGSE